MNALPACLRVFYWLDSYFHGFFKAKNQSFLPDFSGVTNSKASRFSLTNHFHKRTYLINLYTFCITLQKCGKSLTEKEKNHKKP